MLVLQKICLPMTDSFGKVYIKSFFLFRFCIIMHINIYNSVTYPLVLYLASYSSAASRPMSTYCNPKWPALLVSWSLLLWKPPSVKWMSLHLLSMRIRTLRLVQTAHQRVQTSLQPVQTGHQKVVPPPVHRESLPNGQIRTGSHHQQVLPLLRSEIVRRRRGRQYREVRVIGIAIEQPLLHPPISMSSQTNINIPVFSQFVHSCFCLICFSILCFLS